MCEGYFSTGHKTKSPGPKRGDAYTNYKLYVQEHKYLHLLVFLIIYTFRGTLVLRPSLKIN